MKSKLIIVALISPDGRIVESVAITDAKRSDVNSYTPDELPKGWRVALVEPTSFEGSTETQCAEMARVINKRIEGS